jgi:hypothetical protein
MTTEFTGTSSNDSSEVVVKLPVRQTWELSTATLKSSGAAVRQPRKK